MAKDVKKVLILVMGCQDEFFRHQYDIIKETWGKSLPEGFQILYYEGGSYMTTEAKEDKIFVACEDDLQSTFKKTWLALRWLEQNSIKYDYVFRTNTSTYINTTYLYDIVNNHIKDPLVMYGSDIYSLSESFTPYPLCLYARGNGMLMSHELVDVILSEGINLLYLNMTDDVAIGNIINSWHIKNKRDYKQYLKGLPHGWYKCVPMVFDCGHQLCQYGRDDTAEFFNKFCTIQIKRYRERELEEKHYYEFHELMSKSSLPSQNYDDFEKYSNNPSIFIGSILGYVNYDKWLKMDKNKLYLKEISHKASDDAEHWKRKEIQGKNLDK